MKITQWIECDESGVSVVDFDEGILENQLQVLFSSIQPILNVINQVSVAELSACLTAVTVEYGKKQQIRVYFCKTFCKPLV